MKWDFNDGRKVIPASPGKFTWWSHFLGHIQVMWIDGAWRFMNGERIPDGLVRWWR